MVYVSKDKIPTKFTWKEIKQYTNRCANYFLSLGIKKGDRVMLVLKRNYQFWFATLALEKIGAISIPATFQLLPHDYEYRFKFANVTSIICTADGEEICPNVEEALKSYDGMVNKLIVNGEREGWRNFNEEYMRFSTHYPRPDDAPGGEDYMLMYFTSGTSGFPKLAVHNYLYPLGQFHTAKYWHDVDPDGRSTVSGCAKPHCSSTTRSASTLRTCCRCSRSITSPHSARRPPFSECSCARISRNTTFRPFSI